jgi:hypothetical protein
VNSYLVITISALWILLVGTGLATFFEGFYRISPGLTIFACAFYALGLAYFGAAIVVSCKRIRNPQS